MTEKLRNRVHRRLELASLRKKILFYQAAYDKRYFSEFICLLTMFLDKTNHRRQECFVDYDAQTALSTNQVLQIADKYDVISFDVFDTLLFRNVNKPTDVFQLLETENKVYAFSIKRKQAEERARRKKYLATGTDEVTLQEIYQMPELNCGVSPEKLMAAERAKEIACCYANPVLKQLVNELFVGKKRIIAISDMYLDSGFIRCLLKANGYPQLDRIFVSNECGVNKSSGALFDLVYDKLKGNVRVLHIGDNFHSDVMKCKNKAFDRLHYLRATC